MKIDPQRILIASVHTDDAEISSGGTISRFVREGREVNVVVLSKAFARETEVPADECLRALKVLGVPGKNITICDYPVRRLPDYRQQILDLFITIKRNINPDLVLLPSLNDLHQDHACVAVEGLRAFKDRTVFGYLYNWNNVLYDTTCAVKFTAEDLQKKIAAVQEYKSQQKDYMQPEVIKALAITTGVAVGANYAEAFSVIRLIA